MAGLGQQQSIPTLGGDGPNFYQQATSLGAAADVGPTDRAVSHSNSTLPRPLPPALQRSNTWSGDGDNSGNSAASTEGVPEDATAMGVRVQGGGKRRRCVATIQH